MESNSSIVMITTSMVKTDYGGNYTLIQRNTTDTNVENATHTGSEDWKMLYSLPVTVLVGVILILMIFMAISGNILVCIAIFTDRKLKKLSNYFLVSLAIADLWVAVFVMTFAVANDLLGYWPFHMGFCNIWISFDIMSATASILNLCAISFDRYIHIQDPYRYDSKMSWKKVVSLIAGVWTLSAILSFLPINLGWHELGVDKGDGNATVTVAPPSHPVCILELNPVYAIVSSSISFYIPCIVMLTLYFRLYTFARRAVRSIRRTQTVHSIANSDLQDGSKTNKLKASDHKAAITLGVINGVFLACWVPFFIINIIASFCPSCIGGLLFSSLTWLGYFNSILNPIIYSIFNREFRDAFKKILGYKRCKDRCHKTEIFRFFRCTKKKPSQNGKHAMRSLNGNHSFGNTQYNTVHFHLVPDTEKIACTTDIDKSACTDISPSTPNNTCTMPPSEINEIVKMPIEVNESVTFTVETTTEL